MILESKVAAPSPSFLKTMGGCKFDGWAHLHDVGTAGGILIGWNSWLFNRKLTIKKEFSLSVTLHCTDIRKDFSISAVYGSNERDRRWDFFNELTSVRSHLLGPWLLGEQN